jgi:DNA-binding HxlR family transcriptional regulator
MPRISKKILAEQLKQLENDSMITRTVKGSKAPFEVTYTLTEKGVELRRLMDDMLEWGVRNLADTISKQLLDEHTSKVSLSELLKIKNPKI